MVEARESIEEKAMVDSGRKGGERRSMTEDEKEK